MFRGFSFTETQRLQREFCAQVSRPRFGLWKSPAVLQHTASPWSLNLATQNLNVLFSGYNTLFPKEGDKEAVQEQVKLNGEENQKNGKR